MYKTQQVLSSERPNRPKTRFGRNRSFGQIHRSFGRSFGRISGHKISQNVGKICSNIGTQENYPISSQIPNECYDFVYFLISIKLKIDKILIWFCKLFTKFTWNRQQITWNSRKTPFFADSVVRFRSYTSKQSCNQSMIVFKF